MKKALFLASLLGFTTLAFAQATMFDAQPSSFMKVVAANYELEPESEFNSTIHVTVMVEFSNACMDQEAKKKSSWPCNLAIIF